MRERTRLDSAIGGFRELERDLADNVELAELGAAEGDEAVVDDAVAALRALAARAGRARLDALLSGEADFVNGAYDVAWLEELLGTGG